MLTRLEQSFATRRHHASPGFPLRFATPHGAESIGSEIPTAEKRRPSLSALSVFCDTQAEARSYFLGKNVLRASDVPFFELVVDVGSRYFRRGDVQKACSLGWSRAPRGGGAMPLRA